MNRKNILFAAAALVIANMVAAQQIYQKNNHQDLPEGLPKAMYYYGVAPYYPDSIFSLDFPERLPDSPFLKKFLILCTKHSLAISDELSKMHLSADEKPYASFDSIFDIVAEFSNRNDYREEDHYFDIYGNDLNWKAGDVWHHNYYFQKIYSLLLSNKPLRDFAFNKACSFISEYAASMPKDWKNSAIQNIEEMQETLAEISKHKYKLTKNEYGDKKILEDGEEIDPYTLKASILRRIYLDGISYNEMLEKTTKLARTIKMADVSKNPDVGYAFFIGGSNLICEIGTNMQATLYNQGGKRHRIKFYGGNVRLRRLEKNGEDFYILTGYDITDDYGNNIKSVKFDNKGNMLSIEFDT